MSTGEPARPRFVDDRRARSAGAAVTLFDDLLLREFDDRLVNHLPLRVLPISAEPPRDIQFVVEG